NLPAGDGAHGSGDASSNVFNIFNVVAMDSASPTRIAESGDGLAAPADRELPTSFVMSDVLSLGRSEFNTSAASSGRLAAFANPSARLDPLPQDWPAWSLFEQANVLVANGQGSWSGLDASVGGPPTLERIDTRDDLLIAGEGDDMQIGSHGKEVLIGGGAAVPPGGGETARDTDTDWHEAP